MPGDETKLRMLGFDDPDFRKALNEGAIEPAISAVKWYKGPFASYFQDVEMYAEHEVYHAVIVKKQKIWQIGAKRVKEVEKYFESNPIG